MIFTDPHTTNYLKFDIDNGGENCYLIQYHVDTHNGKQFVVLLKYAFEHLKKNGCKYYVQTVFKSEFDKLYNREELDNIKSFTYDDNGFYVTVICDVDYAPTYIMDGFMKVE